MDGGIKIGDTGFDAGRHDRHVDEGRSDIDDDLAAGFFDQGRGCIDIGCIQGVTFKNAGVLKVFLFMDAVDDGLAF